MNKTKIKEPAVITVDEKESNTGSPKSASIDKHPNIDDDLVAATFFDEEDHPAPINSKLKAQDSIPHTFAPTPTQQLLQ